MVQNHNSSTHIFLGSPFTCDERLRWEYYLTGIFNKNLRTSRLKIDRVTLIHISSEISFEV